MCCTDDASVWSSSALPTHDTAVYLIDFCTQASPKINSTAHESGAFPPSASLGLAVYGFLRRLTHGLLWCLQGAYCAPEVFTNCHILQCVFCRC